MHSFYDVYFHLCSFTQSMPIIEICKAATWMSVHTFAEHCNNSWLCFWYCVRLGCTSFAAELHSEGLPLFLPP